LLYSSDNWTIKARDASRITAAEMKCMRKKQQDTLGQIIKQTKRLQRIKYNPSFGKKKYRTTEEIGYDM